MSNTNTIESRFPGRLVLRVPEGFAEQLDDLARREFMTRSQLVRATLLARLRKERAEKRP